MAFDPNSENWPKNDGVGKATDRINNLERDLYSRGAPEITVKDRPDLSPSEKKPKAGWKQDDSALTADLTASAVEAERSEKKSSFATKFFLAAVLFFIVAAGIAAYIILGGFNIISSKNVDISIQGLIAVAAGEELSLDLIVKNNNNSVIDSGTIYVEYPEGTRLASDLTKELTRDHFDFGIVASGGQITETIKPVLFGEKDSVKQIKVSVDYKARGSNALFSKEKTFDITIKSSPILMTVAVPEEVNAGQDIEIKIDVDSNSNTLVRDLLVRVEYPFGFTFTGATPEPAFEKNIWRIGDLSPKEKRTIVLRGRMDGQNEEERTFRFMTGTAAADDERKIAVGYINTQESLFIKKAFIGLTLQINGKTGEQIISAGDKVQGTLIWSNNIPIAINDAVLQVKLSGKGLDRSQVSASGGGFYRSIDNTITWDKNSVPLLSSVEPGESGSVVFNFAALPGTNQLFSSGRNMDIALDVSVKGTRIQSGAPQEIRSAASGLVKIATDIDVSAFVRRTAPPFESTGPVPPKAERETTYTVLMFVSNTFNDASNVVVTTKLPPYVSWLNKVSPTTEPISYDESTRTVTWNIQDLRAGVGYSTASNKQAYFQVSFLPSLSQVGTSPDLTSEITISGTDRFTGTALLSTKPALTTRFNSDPEFENGDDRVVQ